MAQCSSMLQLYHVGLRRCAALSTHFPHTLPKTRAPFANSYSTDIKVRSYFQYLKHKMISPPRPPYHHICQVGDPVLRSKAVAVDPAAIKGPEVQKMRVLDWQTVLFQEACESICGFSATVPRYLSVEVSGVNENGEDTTWRGSGWPARILQHEMDHLNGVLYIDHMDSKTFTNIHWQAYNE
ncbi:peptide deformylase, mitochondrial isoform X2 [Hippocampus zosterae]|uniref:peptide deformylase, mitochondrial isoform X2 n=1 Tax=Hippocampus zosterae TaxID=109293 RepID=UPI00223E3889|nr:peptide deformylase, mitochondrial isoform X2 [Hippocampus zosterae]